MKKVAVIGIGLIGKERLRAIQLLRKRGKEIELVGIYDPFSKEIEKIAQEYKTKCCTSLNELFSINPDWCFVSTPHDVAVNITSEALKDGFKVLVEKPLGRTVAEAKKIINSAKYPAQLWVGFNYRFYEGVQAIINDAHAGRFGELISVTLITGYGHNPEIKGSWKLNPARSGGGCLIDPGVHLIDLARLISKNNLKVQGGSTWKGFWNNGAEEECHLLLKGEKVIFNIQISTVKWRSTFLLEINGTDGYGKVSGRSRYYGNQKYIRGKRWGWMETGSQVTAEELVLETDGLDVFVKETEALLFPTNGLLIKPCSAEESLLNMQSFEECLKVLKDLRVTNYK